MILMLLFYILALSLLTWWIRREVLSEIDQLRDDLSAHRAEVDLMRKEVRSHSSVIAEHEGDLRKLKVR